MKRIWKGLASIKGLVILSLMMAASMWQLGANQWTGWITDQPCAQVGNYAGVVHQKHITDGLPVVFVNDVDKAMYVISNPDKVKNFGGEKVVLTGTVKPDGTIEAESATRSNQGVE